MVVEAGQQIVRGHDPAGEEFSSHPLFGIIGVVVVGESAMRKDVHEHLYRAVHAILNNSRQLRYKEASMGPCGQL